MGRFLRAILMPHAPVLLPDVGYDHVELREIRKAMQLASHFLLAEKSDLLLVISPHGPRHDGDALFWATDNVHGDLDAFGFPDVALGPWPQDQIFRDLCLDLNGDVNIHYTYSAEIDHGSLVPLFFLKTQGHIRKVVILSVVPWLKLEKIRFLAKGILAANERLDRRVSILVSGDFSHRLNADAPGGYHPSGQIFDNQLIGFLKKNSWSDILNMSHDLKDLAGQDVWTPLALLLLLNQWQANLLHYTSPFGVGYGVATFQGVD